MNGAKTMCTDLGRRRLYTSQKERPEQILLSQPTQGAPLANLDFGFLFSELYDSTFIVQHRESVILSYSIHSKQKQSLVLVFCCCCC